MIRTTLRMALRPDQGPALVKTFQRLGILETSTAQPGCLSAEISLAEDGAHALVTATWEDRAAYERWTSRRDRSDQAGDLNTHLAVPLSADTVGEIYQIGHSLTA